MKKLFLILCCIFLLFNVAIAQETTTTTLRFQWNSNTEEDLAGYGFYFGDTEGVYNIWENDIPTSETDTVNFTAEGITVNINNTTYFAVDAFNTAGNRSGFSIPCEYIHCVPLPEETQTISCGEGYTGEKTQKRTSSCSFNSYPTWGAWVDVSNTCQAIPVCTPLPDETRTVSCLAGQTGSITESRSSSCLNGTLVWGAWTQTSNTCTTIPVCVSKTETRTVRCTKWYEKGSILQSHTLVCNSDGTSYWTAWTTISSTCKPWFKK